MNTDPDLRPSVLICGSMHVCDRVGLLEERVLSLVRGREKDDPWDVFRNPRQGGSKSRRGGSPYQEHRIDIVQGSVESINEKKPLRRL